MPFEQSQVELWKSRVSHKQFKFGKAAQCSRRWSLLRNVAKRCLDGLAAPFPFLGTALCVWWRCLSAASGAPIKFAGTGHPPPGRSSSCLLFRRNASAAVHHAHAARQRAGVDDSQLRICLPVSAVNTAAAAIGSIVLGLLGSGSFVCRRFGGRAAAAAAGGRFVAQAARRAGIGARH